MTKLVSYDISSNKRRKKVVTRLQAWGERLQKSVFLVSGDSEKLKILEKQLAKIIDSNDDSVLILPICENCQDSTATHGTLDLPKETSAWYVL
ncbi:CRISPR-associated endonuclease Cas2 [Corynebacterium sp. ES2794-CONJ1]|uniref:CRISPR-associated endonuclease Cas2 n=1 Tax=Corynebacterium sp. ES2794-CONJ1 TaxID=2980553 RepID=UPI0021DA07C8|nr:CRISPR-associated endonuclease Cas2 [Corynebacterium sp. ES2794-CONJ1]MCU9518921.1 CRISPR-associated endonuclease Cas2 [Corynebacterium sp. ES2794-CONJ1]